MDRNELPPLPPEVVPPAEEFPDPAPEQAVPPPEFPVSGGPEAPAPGRRRRRLLYLLAAGALLLLLGGRLLPAALPAAAPVPAAQPSPPVSPVPTPMPTPEPEPEPTPEPTPEPEPACQILFYAFSSSHHTHLLFTRPEAFRSVTLELWEPVLDIPVETYRFGPDELSGEELILPEFDAGSLYFEHLEEYRALDAFPELLRMHAVLVYEQDGQIHTEERDLFPSPEQGWAMRYWPVSTEKSDYAFPGCFVFSTYESETPVTLVLDEPDAVKPGTLSVSFSIDGRAVDPAAVEYQSWKEAYTIADIPVSEPFFFTRFVFPKPDWAPEEGTLHLTVVQYLEGYGRVLVLERDCPYSESPEQP